MKISEMFGLGKSQYELDFVDIDPERDTRLFVDPHFLGARTDTLSRAATRTLQNFFDTFLSLVRDGRHDDARALFAYLGEPNETCLGLSRGNPRGRGIGQIQADQLFESLVNSRAVQTGLIEDIEDCRLFIPNFDKDKLSDLTTNVIRGQLIEYTQAQCRLWGLPMVPGAPSGWIWRTATRQWESEYTEMLIVGERPIILVPKGIVSYSKAYTAQKFHRHYVLNYLKNEHLRMNSALLRRTKSKAGVERVWITKKDIEIAEAPCEKNYLSQFAQGHLDVFRNFKAQSARNLESLGNEELSEREAGEIVGFVLDQLRNIPPGGEAAGEYHRLVVGVLELAFYPSLIYPAVEQEINEGRKRIDIVFDNADRRGFFHSLHTRHNITCPYIFVECKNYSRDIGNPELDQMIARFSPNRGRFGIVICRAVEDMDLLLARCQDAHRDQQGTILPLVDTDLELMLEAIAQADYEAVHRLLALRLRSIVVR